MFRTEITEIALGRDLGSRRANDAPITTVLDGESVQISVPAIRSTKQLSTASSREALALAVAEFNNDRKRVVVDCGAETKRFHRFTQEAKQAQFDSFDLASPDSLNTIFSRSGKVVKAETSKGLGDHILVTYSLSSLS